MTKSTKSITFTIIFEASALNRDEKLGGNIPSIKKLTRFGKDSFSYISKVAIRHYLYSTLNRNNDSDWRPASCSKVKGGVIQFDLTKENILNNAEIDSFGYMYTESSPTITRKGVIGITKAISLETWEGDMQFNANHDLVKRANSTPDPVNKEEHVSYYKVSFTIDCEKLGIDEWVLDSRPEYKEKEGIFNFSKSSEEKDITYQIENVGSIEIKKMESKYKVIFKLSEKKKKERIYQIVSAIKNGLIYHVSGENWGIVPKFIISAGLNLPIPIFNSFVNLQEIDSEIFENDYILKSDSKKLVYIQNIDNTVKNIDSSNLYTKWEEYLTDLGLK